MKTRDRAVRDERAGGADAGGESERHGGRVRGGGERAAEQEGVDADSGVGGRLQDVSPQQGEEDGGGHHGGGKGGGSGLPKRLRGGRLGPYLADGEPDLRNFCLLNRLIYSL